MMASDGPCPPSCDDEVYHHGTHVFTTHTIPSNAMEQWVKKVAQRSGRRVDWHFGGGRAIVLALGDIRTVNLAIEELLPEHDALYTEACRELFESVGDTFNPEQWPPPRLPPWQQP